MPIHGYPGNVITANPTAPTVSSASGVWTTEQQLLAVNQGNWPGYEYPVNNSLRFNSADSAYLNRTLTTPTNNKIFTFSAWVKRSALGAAQTLFDAFVPATSFDTFRFNSSDQLDYFDNTAGYLTSTQVFRDVGAWYHVMAAVDTTQATSSNRVKLYVNGTQITAFSASAYPSQNQAIIFNSAVAHGIGRFGYSANAYLSGYLTEVNFIDGQALTPSSFGLNDPETGVWSPKQYTGTYGTNGFYLKFVADSNSVSFSSDYLVVAGGGGGGGFGGGGAGGYRELTSQSLNIGTPYTVTVGAGGSGATVGSAKGTSGSDSVFSSITSTGGGGGGAFSTANATGINGGSGGGGGTDSTNPFTGRAGGTGNTPSTSPSQGNNGGSGVTGGTAGGGGGGASAVGANAATNTGGAGGAGTASSITGSSVTRGGGGGGGGLSGRGAGGAGGGGQGGISPSGSGVANGTANTGGGGGGSYNGPGGNGGSGVVIIKIPKQYVAFFTSGVTFSVSTAVSGFNIYTVTATSTTSETVTFTTLGTDYSSNGNNWTSNNFSITAGVGNDVLADSPTSYGTDTGVGGTVRGNYATLNPLAKSSVGTLDNGNLQWTSGNSGGGTAGNGTRASIGMNVGKWYTEVTRLDTVFWSYPGISNESHLTSIYNGGDANSWSIDASGQKVTNNSSSAYGSATWAANDIINIAYDADNGELYFGKNGTWLNSGNPVTRTNPAFTSLSGTLFFTVGFSANTASASSVVFNFGQRAFAYTAPSGFKALCTQNLPTPTIGATSTTQANDYFNAVLYTGNSANPRSITGVGFQPDWVWVKQRSSNGGGFTAHQLYDAVRGTQKLLRSNTTDAELANPANGGVQSFDSDGFTVQGSSSLINMNDTGETYVAWNWKANGAGSSNTAGTITSTVSANTTSGFSIVTYTGTGASATVGHGLGVAPSFIIAKWRTGGSTQGWVCYHSSLGSSQYLVLNTTAAAATNAPTWVTNPTSTVFSVSTDNWNNGSGFTFVAYCFAPVAGYSAFGSYTGNGSTDGPFVYTGFRPRFLLLKISSTTGDWAIYDTSRNTYNVMDLYLYPNSSAAEGGSGTPRVDALSNGFKLRNSGQDNTSSATYIYAAFAESPFKYSRAR